MNTAQTPTRVRMSVEEFLALPDDGVHRELINGEVRVMIQETWDDPNAPIIPVAAVERPMTIRNRIHSRIETKFAYQLEAWLQTQPEPRGEVLTGEVGFRMGGREDSAVGIDVAFASAELVAATPEDQKVYIGCPVLAVEILSPSDTQQTIADMIANYLRHGVLVWVAEPNFRTVSVYRPGRPPESFNETQELSGDPYLPGFRVAVSRLFS